MARLTKLQIKMRKTLAKASSKQLKTWKKDAILREVLDTLLGDENTVAISSVTKKDVADVLGVDLTARLATADDEGINWNITEAVKFDASPAFMSHYQDLKKFYHADSEPMTRAYLDAYLLEVLRNLAEDTAQSLKVFGEIAVACTANGKTLNGFGDWFLGYGEKGDSLLKNVSLLGEAKEISVDISSEQALCQVFSYMLIVHRIRKEEGKAHARVYGFITNRRRWLFLMVDDNGDLKKTQEFAEAVQQDTILANLRFIFSSAQQSSPSTTPSSSLESLTPPTQSESLEYGNMEIACVHNSLATDDTEDEEGEESEEEEEEEK
ncbi:hypothetical protein HK104_003990 [Borealophlyctis nickersoniae]|nr:hypothetical protein HK104_003990 [Borealophlyctis nickersoniae]